eukprot:CAMPEP_0174717902 /NCGR_PEP_ID=MMETSP1094-20130205/27481_1 /TAXON_ID=156173 /ORGANISM="Chrysochromulina brevifilum, Strain UTEX LB 985" /LENGTH=341 /DNA_ID=CAMNT_0015917905 /DNA_START=37 /DNA_END=1062 /DNA_ORIENTATION=+
MPPAKKQKSRKAPEVAPEATDREHEVEDEAVKEEDDDGDDDDDDDDDDEEPLNLGTADVSEETLNIDFGFYDPKPLDFHGMRALLVGRAVLLPEGAAWDVGGLADVLCEQAAVGSVVKTVGPGEGNEEPADDEVLGFMSAVNLHAHRDARFAQEIRASLIKRCPSGSKRDELTTLLDDAHCGMLLSERMLNLPAVLVPSLIDSLLQDIAWAAEHADAAERESFRFTRLVLVTAVSLSGDGASEGQPGEAGSSGMSEAVGGSLSGGAAGEKKKKKKRKQVEDAAALFESLTFARVEEELLAAAGDWHTLLNGTGRSRQLVVSLSPEQVRKTLPALIAAMGES